MSVLYVILCREDHPDDTPETKRERERIRRQANNARERYIHSDTSCRTSDRSQLYVIFKHRNAICRKKRDCCVLFI